MILSAPFLPLQVALDYSSILLQLRQNRWQQQGDTDPPSSMLQELAEQSRHINMLEEDENWLPVTLEFFLQVCTG